MKPGHREDLKAVTLQEELTKLSIQRYGDQL
jgi:hypothetical protein